MAARYMCVPAPTLRTYLSNKPVDIRGPNYGISPNGGIRVAEAVVVPATSATATGEIFSVSASGVSINGFTIDGDNPLLTSGYLGTNGADIDAAEGVTVYFDNVNNLTVSKNIFQNLSYFGVTLFGASYSAPATTGHLVDDNLFTDLGTYDSRIHRREMGRWRTAVQQPVHPRDSQRDEQRAPWRSDRQFLPSQPRCSYLPGN